MNPTASLAVVLLASAVLGGCATKAQVEVTPPLPALVAPPVPPRIVASYPVDVPPEPEEPQPEVEATAPAPVPARPAPKAVPVEPPRTEGPGPAPPPPLTLTPAPGTDSQTETSIRTLLGRAARDLARVNAGTLSTDGRTQYDAAKRFVQQSEDALKARNLLFASKLADKAATMAAVLVR